MNFKCTVPVANHELQQKISRSPKTVPTVDIRWLMPATFVLHFTYPNGLVHEICGFATPIDDSHIRRIQFVYRNDSEDDASADSVAKFDRSVAAEDRRMLESVDTNFVLSPVLLAHMMLDRPGLLMRRQLSKLLAELDPNAALAAAELDLTDTQEMEIVA